MSTEMIQSAYIGLCLRYAGGEAVRHLVSDDLCINSLRSCEGSQRDTHVRQKGAENA